MDSPNVALQETAMSETVATAAEPIAKPRGGQAALVIMVLMVLALAVATGLTARDAAAMRSQVNDLTNQVAEARAAFQARTTAIDTSLSPLAVGYAKAAQERLKAGDKTGAETQLRHARVLAKSVKDLGTGTPPTALVTALTDAEKALGETPTLSPDTKPAMGGT
jgi:uncharacterized protein HemX